MTPWLSARLLVFVLRKRRSEKHEVGIPAPEQLAGETERDEADEGTLPGARLTQEREARLRIAPRARREPPGLLAGAQPALDVVFGGLGHERGVDGGELQVRACLFVHGARVHARQ